MLKNHPSLHIFLFLATLFVGALGCDTIGTPEPEPADGSFERPFTAIDPGPNGQYFPILYGSLVDVSRVRLWVEILDSGGLSHPMEVNNYVTQIYIADEFNNEIANAGFQYTSQARIIQTVEIPEEITSVNVYYNSSANGWFLATYSVEEAARVAPAGDNRRPYTEVQTGPWGDEAISHLPVVGQQPETGRLTLEVGDRATDALHVMIEDHYIGQILVFDQFDQLRFVGNLDPAYNPEPVLDMGAIGGTEYLRVLSFCNQHSWWEAVWAF